MFGDIGWTEIMLIGIVALIVIGPEDLPDMFRQVGRFTAKLRQMSREFSRAMEQAAKDSGVKDVADDLKAAASPANLGLSKVKEAADRFEKWDPIKNAAKPTVANKPLVPPPMPAAPAAAEVAPAAVVEPKILGPETQALMDKQAAKKAILAETAEKLKAVDTGATTAKAASKAEVKPAVKPRVRKPVAAAEPAVVPVVAAKPAPKPRAPRTTAPRTTAPRKTKKADEV
ncbi:MAG: Sec-independent protein translocase protein TatB [Cypionkella sp.]|uniref:Sec-independent protein translocase protein TatB n=1 Tax=Cypionkella sp. TaxID=2811411 RepID=UPI002ABB7046|nr:Sec-independent protein translocase protein TatB [Cypionkella sp.]MDZ4309251.1 Sec-independent protein translocase protein TatB [Cypionkella sp.]